MEGTNQSLENDLIQEELRNLKVVPTVPQKWSQLTPNPSIWNSYEYILSQSDRFMDHNRHRFSHYADKQLRHLVVSQQFDFAKIAQMLNYIFRDERTRFTEAVCRQRWEELHVLRELGDKVNEKKMQHKRATSVSTFSDPFSLYNLEEMLDELQKNQQAITQDKKQSSLPNSGSGYNIFKNSIRRIDDMELYRQRQAQMMHALSSAQDPQNTITDKLMHFSPYYERLNEFEVIAEELTEQKMKEIMSMPIQMQKLQYQLRTKDMNELNEGFKPKRAKKEESAFEREKEARYEIQENWDDYESD